MSFDFKEKFYKDLNDTMDEMSIYTKDNDGLFTEGWIKRRTIYGGEEAKDILSGILGVSKEDIVKILWKRVYLRLRFRFELKEMLIKEYLEKELETYKKFHQYRRVHDIVILSKYQDKKIFESICAHVENNYSESNISALFKALFLEEKDEFAERKMIDVNFRSDFGNQNSRFAFLQEGMIVRYCANSYSIKPEENIVYLTHGDPECLCADGVVDKEGTNIPIDVSDTETISMDDDNGRFHVEWDVVSVLTDRDMISGGNENLKRCLEYSIKNSGQENFYVHGNCASTIMGDDIPSIAKHFSEKYNVNVSCTQAGREHTRLNRYLFAFEKRLDAAGENLDKIKKEKGAINLMAFPKDISIKNIVDLLRLSGIKTNFVFHSDIRIEDIEKSLSSEAQILFSNRHLDETHERLFKRMNIKTITPEPPYGFNKTRMWFDSVHEVLGKKPSQEFEDEVRALEQEYDDLKEISQRYTIGIVLTKLDFDRFLNPVENHDSIPIIELLAEMNFNLKIHIYSTVDEFIDFRERLLASFPFLDGSKVTFCTDEITLYRWISEADLILSDLKHDKRIARLGKPRFSQVNSFKLGFHGAIESLRRLNAKVEERFERRYFKHFNDEMIPIYLGEL